jgi:hypothetical protein
MKPISITEFPGGLQNFFWLGQNYHVMTSYPTQGVGNNLDFGGEFVTVPTAVATMAHRDPVVSPGGVVAGGATPAGVAGAVHGAFAAEASTHGAVSHHIHLPVVLTQRTDVFGLGNNYAMYHKRFWGVVDQNHLEPWESLGGAFTSTPAAITWADGRVDLFGVGLDHAMYTKTCADKQWTSDWLNLGGTFTSAATLVTRGPKLLEIFARGADFTLRSNHTDGASWFGWQNLGGALASPPVAVSWGADRTDVFAIFNDGALWHRWWDGEIWNEWETLGGSYIGEPAVASCGPGCLDIILIDAQTRGLRHQSFRNNTWSNPETVSTEIYGVDQKVADSPSIISTEENQLEVFVPTDTNDIWIFSWNGMEWSRKSAMAKFRVPQRYRIAVDTVHVKRARSLNTDTDAAMISVAAGNAAAQITTQWIGDIGGTNSKYAETNLLFIDPVCVDLAEPMTFSYIIVNNGSAPQDKILATLAKAGNSLSLASSASMQTDIAKGIVKFISVKLLGAVAAEVPAIGPILSLVGSWLMDKLTGVIFAKCDGLVAVELRAMMGRDLCILTDNGRKAASFTTTHDGTDSPVGCGANSIYEVSYYIEPL